MFSLLCCVVCTGEAACECTESDLETIRKSWKSVTRMITPQRAIIFQAFLDEITKSDADLAAVLQADMVKLSQNDCGNKSGKCWWYPVIHLYPNVAHLKAYIEYRFKTYPDIAPTWFGYSSVIADTFVT